MEEKAALKLAQEVQEILLNNEQWCTVSYDLHPNLKMIKIESSIKIDQPKKK